MTQSEHGMVVGADVDGTIYFEPLGDNGLECPVFDPDWIEAAEADVSFADAGMEGLDTIPTPAEVDEFLNDLRKGALQ